MLSHHESAARSLSLQPENDCYQSSHFPLGGAAATVSGRPSYHWKTCYPLLIAVESAPSCRYQPSRSLTFPSHLPFLLPIGSFAPCLGGIRKNHVRDDDHNNRKGVKEWKLYIPDPSFCLPYLRRRI